MNGSSVESKRAHATRYQSKLLTTIHFPHKNIYVLRSK